MTTDQIVKKIVLKAPRERVWEAVSNSAAFGSWFGVEFDGPFAIGSPISGRMVPTQVDPEMAKLQEPHKGKLFQAWVECIEPMRKFAFRWHPFEIDPAGDHSKEPTTLVTFELSEVKEGTLLTITESGFDQIPIERRAQAFESNDGGWTHQAKLIEKYILLQD